MIVKEAITLFQYYQRSSHKERTTASTLHLLKKFESLYAERPFDSMEADEIYRFLETPRATRLIDPREYPGPQSRR